MTGRNRNIKGELTANGPIKYWTDEIEIEEEPKYENYNNCLDEKGNNVENYGGVEHFGIGSIFSSIGSFFGDTVRGIFSGLFGKWGPWIEVLIVVIIILALLYRFRIIG